MNIRMVLSTAISLTIPLCFSQVGLLQVNVLSGSVHNLDFPLIHRVSERVVIYLVSTCILFLGS